MGWTQWGKFQFSNKTHEDTLKLKFPNSGDSWGYPFVADSGDRTKLAYSEIEDQKILPQTSYAYGQTGKQNEWAGMSATVEIYTMNSTGGLGEKVAKYYYSCPWSGNNSSTISNVASGWNLTQWGADMNGDSLGSVTIEIRRA